MWMIHTSRYPWFMLNEKILQFKALCFRLSMEFSTRVFALVLMLAHQWGIHLQCCLDNWLVVFGTLLCMFEHCHLRIIINMDKPDLKSTSGLIPRNAVHTIQESIFIKITRFWGAVTTFLSLQASSKAVTRAPWLHGFTGMLHPAWQAQDVSTTVAIKRPLVLFSGQTH